jgi:hypothetical protein
MWWLQFAEGGAAIVAATSLAQARLIAVIHGLGRASTLVEGFAIDAHLLELIPNDHFGRRLSSCEIEEVLARLRVAARNASREASWTAPMASDPMPTGPQQPKLR